MLLGFLIVNLFVASRVNAQCSPTVYWTQKTVEDYPGQLRDRVHYILIVQNNCNMTVTVRVKHYGGTEGSDLVCHTYTLNPGQKDETDHTVSRQTDLKYWFKFRGDKTELPSCDIGY